MPILIQHFRGRHPDVEVRLHENKAVRLLPRRLSGCHDLAFVRPPDIRDPRIHYCPLFWEAAVVALPAEHRLAVRALATIADFEGGSRLEGIPISRRSSRKRTQTPRDAVS